MNARYIHVISISVMVIGMVLIVFLYWTEPRSLAEVATKGEVVVGAYAVDTKQFDAGLVAFRRDEFTAARAAFSQADPERRDPTTQFYIAYSYYREGWGRLSSDGALFTAGIEVVNRVIAIDANYRVNDDSLVMKTPFELKAELEEGTKVTISDFNPTRLTRTRK